MLPVYVNGRFLTQPLTGVQRYACEILRALDELLESSPESAPFALLVPQDTRETLGLKNVPERRIGRLSGHLWEQVELPRHAADGVLLSLSTTGPAQHRRHLVTIHDAGVYANPGNFSLAFRIWYRTLIPMLRRSASSFFTVSEFSKQELVKYCHIPAHKIVVTYNGMDHVKRHPSDADYIRQNGLVAGEYVLCVGADNPNKNIGLVAEALEILGDESLTLVNVGAANPRVFKASAGHAGFAQRHLGHVPDSALRALYEGALCLAFPSFYEGFGIPPLEAMSCGCPTVVARTSALPEACGDAALYCDPRDARELAEHLRSLRGETALRQRLATAGLERASSFTWIEAARRILDVTLTRAAGSSLRQNK